MQTFNKINSHYFKKKFVAKIQVKKESNTLKIKYK